MLGKVIHQIQIQFDTTWHIAMPYCAMLFHLQSSVGLCAEGSGFRVVDTGVPPESSFGVVVDDDMVDLDDVCKKFQKWGRVSRSYIPGPVLCTP